MNLPVYVKGDSRVSFFVAGLFIDFIYSIGKMFMLAVFTKLTLIK
jgi:hypothetical protein